MKKSMLITGGILGVVYLGLFSFSSSGYGYAGHGGYNHGPSFFYFGGTSFYPNRSVRNGSVGGPGGRGQGLQYGK